MPHPLTTPFQSSQPAAPKCYRAGEGHRAKGIQCVSSQLLRSALFAFVVLAMSASAFAQIGISVSFAPPELPVYDQPLCPGDGYSGRPGIGLTRDDDYYFVPGTWVHGSRGGVALDTGLLGVPQQRILLQ